VTTSYIGGRFGLQWRHAIYTAVQQKHQRSGAHTIDRTFLSIADFFLLWVAGCVAAYHANYCQVSWEQPFKGVQIRESKRSYLPGEEKPKPMKKWEYFNEGFTKRTAFKGKDYAY